MFHPSIIENSVSLSPSHPNQGRILYDEYVQATEFHYTMQGLISDHCFPYDDSNIQDMFITHLNHSSDIFKIVNHECSSSLASIKLKYSASLFVHMISGHVAKLGLKTKSLSIGFMSKFPSRQKNL